MNIEFFVYKGTNQFGKNNEYCISLMEDDPWHDIAMADELGLDYDKYIVILNKNNGIQYENKIEYAKDDILDSTDTWFKSEEDCLNAIEDIKNYLKQGEV